MSNKSNTAAPEPCPWCKAVPKWNAAGSYFIDHEKDCFLRAYSGRMVLSPDDVAAWNTTRASLAPAGQGEAGVIALLREIERDESRKETEADGMDYADSAKWHQGRRELVAGILAAIAATPSSPAISEAELSEIEARANAATEGPWFRQGNIVSGPDRGGIDIGTLIADVYIDADSEFVTKARTDILKLIAAVRASSPAPDKGEVASGDTDQIAMWLRDLDNAGWARNSASVFQDPEGRLWRGPYAAWCELQTRKEQQGVASIIEAELGGK